MINHTEPGSLTVVSMRAYEHTVYTADDGRVFVTIGRDSGFLTYSETIVLTESQKQSINENQDRLIRDLRDSFGGANNEFRLPAEQKIADFDQWKSARSAVEKWRNQSTGTA